ncbi:hypothetical protein FHX10_006621 [Rhizobium sp. BK591]|uniref:hypothetical protein n=1 Tax=Rhizobium sp. BK591 TaxID=2586985 RepID=UPI0010EED7B7|nr:hypothetical protein [Rhizobium sp. BK591]MBB3747068.1 hypothetical protein [Rhizobium sp. BK591]
MLDPIDQVVFTDFCLGADQSRAALNVVISVLAPHDGRSANYFHWVCKSSLQPIEKSI